MQVIIIPRNPVFTALVLMLLRLCTIAISLANESSAAHRIIFGAISDIHLQLPVAAELKSCDGDWLSESGTSILSGDGVTRECLAQSVLDHYASLSNTPSVLLLGGDNVRHGVRKVLGLADDYSTGSSIRIARAVLGTEARVARILCSKIPAGGMVLPVVGNNDMPDDWTLPHAVTQRWYHALFKVWWKLIAGCSHTPPWSIHSQKPLIAQTFQLGGFYRVHLPGRVDVLCLNTVLWSRKAKFRQTHQSRVASMLQLSWLRRCLNESRKLGRSVVVVGHVPPGIDTFYGIATWVEPIRQAYVQLLFRYYNVIAGQFFSHFHRDSFRILGEGQCQHHDHEKAQQSTTDCRPMVVFLSPAVSVVYGNRPAYRIYDINFKNMIIDYNQYYLKGRRWSLDYQFSSSIPQDQQNSTASQLQVYSHRLQGMPTTSDEWQSFCHRYFLHNAESSQLCSNPVTQYYEACALTEQTNQGFMDCVLRLFVQQRT